VLRQETAHHTSPFDASWLAYLRPTASDALDDRSPVPAGGTIVATATLLEQASWQAWGGRPPSPGFRDGRWRSRCLVTGWWRSTDLRRPWRVMGSEGGWRAVQLTGDPQCKWQVWPTDVPSTTA
jgi:hypothetical protein